MNKSIAVMIACFLSATAAAGTAIMWKAPTARTDGRLLSVSEIAKYKLFVDDALVADNISATATSTTTTVPAGVHTIKMLTVDTGGRASDYSAAVTKTVTDPVPPAPNLALNKPVVVSSIESSTYTGGKAVDGLATTRWASILPGKDPEWLRVDLGGSFNVNKVVIRWDGAYARSYEVQGSIDGISWTVLYTTSAGVGGVSTIVIPINASRYVRIFGKVRATQWGYSIYDIEIYGTKIIVPPPPDCSAEEAAVAAETTALNNAKSALGSCLK
jgi:hypothetical protein